MRLFHDHNYYYYHRRCCAGRVGFQNIFEKFRKTRFSEQNVKSTNKFRSIYSTTQKNNTQSLPLLKNDTNDIIEYRNDIEIYKKSKKKYKFWNLIEK